MLAAQIIECGLEAPKGHYSLEQTVARYVRPYYTAQGNLFAPTVTKQIRSSFADIGDADFTYEQIFYGAFDVEAAYALKRKLLAKAEELDLTKTLELEFEFLKVLGDMELNGIYLDKEKWIQNARVVEANAEELRQQLLAIKDINWDSPKQAVAYLKEVGVDVLTLDKKTGEIKESVGRIVLMKQEARFPILKTYLEYKLLKKKAVSYGEKFLRHINPHSDRVHSSFMQIMRTGRISSTNPNLQNISRGDVYRSAFMADEDDVLVVADFSNQEARLIADKSADANMLKAAGKDFHLEVAKIAYNNPDLTKNSEERRLAKSIGFLIGYGGGAKKLADQFGISMKEAKDTIKWYYSVFPGLEQYFRMQGEQARKNGYILINSVSGRKSFIPFYEKYVQVRDYIKRQKARGGEVRPEAADYFSYYDSKIQRWSQNIPVQGTAADIGKYAGILLRKYAQKLPFKIVLFVHDEIILQCPASLAKTVAKILEKCCLEASRAYTTHMEIPAEAVITKI
jgi:DNA polymerase-1